MPSAAGRPSFRLRVRRGVEVPFLVKTNEVQSIIYFLNRPFNNGAFNFVASRGYPESYGCGPVFVSELRGHHHAGSVAQPRRLGP